MQIVISEVIATIVLFIWVIFLVTLLTKRIYEFMRRNGLRENVAVYYNRKIIHILAGGVVAVIIPYTFTTPILPLIMALLLGLFTYIPHRTGRLMYWFQVKNNMYEVTFCIMWGVVIALGWFISNGNFWFGVLPVLFMSVGDAVTGLVRNTLFKKRTKSWWGNLAMASVSIPMGAVMGVAGMIAGALASFIEHFEYHPIDDNITVPLTSFIVLILAMLYAPSLLTI
ncbi:MAG: dolichol kinase [Aigarchaeota archaeon]|nr:dolichol kinase [Aigarchaeota archaeon]MCX8193695.1 dolichol kinase [Nitrososphaeria archaeon]